MSVVWTTPADTDREQIVLFIAKDNPQNAVAMDALFTEAADSLAALPSRGKPGRMSNTRELIIHKSYILVYSHDDENDVTYIKAVLHTSRQWPPVAED